MLLSKIAFLLTLMPSVESYDGINLERIQRYLGSGKPQCAQLLGALQFLLTTPPKAPISKLGWEVKYDDSTLQEIRQKRSLLMAQIRSPRLRRESVLALWRSRVLETRSLLELEGAIKVDQTTKSQSSFSTHVHQWVGVIIQREREMTDAILHALEIQAQLEPDGIIDPTFSFHHSSDEDRMWVWRFDHQPDQTGEYFTESSRELLKPLAPHIRDISSSSFSIDQALRDEIIRWFDSRALIGPLADEMKLRDFSMEYRQDFVRMVKALGVPGHPFAKRAIERNPDMNLFLEGKVFYDHEAIDVAEMNAVLKKRDIERAEQILKNAEEYTARRNMEPDYFDLEPVVMIAIRELLSQGLYNSNALGFVPRRTRRDGNQIIAFDGLQFHIFRKPSGEIQRIQLQYRTSDQIIHLFQPVALAAGTTPKESQNPQDTLTPRPEVKRDQHPIAKPDPTPLDLSELELPQPVIAEFDRLNQVHPGHHEFLELSAQLVAGYPDFFESRGMTWFFQKVSRRMHLDARAGKDAAIEELERDIQKYQDNRDEFDRAVADDKKRIQIDAANTLGAFIRNGEESLGRLKPDTAYTFQFPRAQKPITLKFSPELIEFLQNPVNNGIQFLRAIQRGPVGKRSVSGVVKLYADIKRDYDLDYEIRVIRKGAHLRPVVRVLPDGTWYVLKVVNELPQ